MRRRALLGTAAASLAGVAGCLGMPGDGSGANDGPERTMAMEDDSGGETDGIAPTLVSVQRGLVRMTYPDAASVLGEDTRHVVVSVKAGGIESPPVPGDFSLRVGGETHAPQEIGPDHEYRRLGPFYTADDPVGQLVFAVPSTVEADDAALTWPSGELALPESARDRMAVAPEFSVSIEEPDAGPAFTLAVTNEGDRPQRFLAAVNLAGPEYGVAGTPSTVVDGGATERLTVSIPGPFAATLTDRPDEEIPPGEVAFDWVGGEAHREFSLE